MANRTSDPSSSIGRRRSQARSEPSEGYVERRDQLLRAAGDVIKRKGLQATSINDIAAELGTDRASVYYYYGSKEDIFHDLVGRVLEELIVATETLAASSAPTAEKLTQVMELVFESFEVDYPYVYLYIQEDMTRVNPSDSASAVHLDELARRYEAAIAGIVRDGMAAGELRSGLEPRLLTLAILGAMSWSHRWFRPGGRFTGAQIGREFAGYFLDGVAAPDGSRR